MPKRKGKLKGVTFQLVHRSQQDPLVADETAPQRVLVPLNDKETKDEKQKRLDEQHKYGIYFDDDHNYLQNLKDPRDNVMEWPDHVEKELEERKQAKPKLNLPSSVFASQIEEDVGMLSKAAPVSGPQLHLDPDIVAAMDDDFDYDDPENQLEDDFIQLAQGVASDEEYFDENDEDNYIDSDMDDVGSLDYSDKSFNNEETKSRFTNYSMTSSVIRRNDQLTLLDDRFEKMYADYDDNEIGSLETEEIEGHVPESSDILMQYAAEFERDQKKEHLDNEKITNKILEQLEQGSDEEEDGMKYVEIAEKDKWDCETILSTYSNVYNHPKLITEPPSNKIKIDKKTGVPKDVLGANKLTTRALNQLNAQNGISDDPGTRSFTGQSVISQLSALSIRPKDETSEDRRERKKALKDYRKERRLEKKMNSDAFKEEAKRQVKIAINNRNNVQGNKIL
ncbi:hypothetical protein GWI33_019455 [Rhynchophorus ferrugineus]|uniref:Protein LTV1 homolog n=1 Tax=Rhynchophorus ferrugineus TaxID=354439 RepID=A0A834HRJ8_RHYFE|nr:hypothetical protein GWI33_019455 [Rhynchophorus ferrugineus]